MCWPNRTSHPLDWTFLKQKPLLSEGYNPLTRTQTTNVILSQTPPGPNGSASLIDIWQQKSSQHLEASYFTHACHQPSSFTTTQHTNPSDHMSFLLCSPPFNCSVPQCSPPISTYYPSITDMSISPSHVTIWDSHSLYLSSSHYWHINQPFSSYSLGSPLFINYPWLYLPFSQTLHLLVCPHLPVLGCSLSHRSHKDRRDTHHTHLA